MIDRGRLLSDLQALLKRLEADLLQRSESAEVPDVGRSLRAEFERAKTAKRTAQNYEDWRTDYITQMAAAWVLSCVFVRFLEDNLLIDPPKIAGPTTSPSGNRLQRARDEWELYLAGASQPNERDYLLTVLSDLAKLPGTKDVFGQHNPIAELPNWLSGDAARELLNFFQKINPETGLLVHDFSDAGWDTRFLGDLYQDLSEAARKKYALLQTPEFVEEFILDRTLDPAIEEFGLEQVLAPEAQQALPGMDGRERLRSPFRMIDPACGSGHFLLGAFRRLLDRWQRKEPGGKPRELVQRALDSIYGVDVNPYAVAIARFRLLLAAMRASGITRLADAPAFHLNLVVGDSLLHAPLRGGQMALDYELTSDDAECEHAYQSEDLPALKQILRGGQYHAVVANPPYIVPRDRQLNERYRKRFSTCHMKYSLAVPFMERIFRLAVDGGFTGQITANSFMKREFGKKLIEQFLPTVDLTHVIDSQLAHIPGHGTPHVILFGRHRRPLASTIRLVGAIARENEEPADPSRGLVWSAILAQMDQPGSRSEFVSVGDSPRDNFHMHPWSIGGGGAAELKEQLEEYAAETLSNWTESIGFASFTGQDDAFVASRSALKRARIPSAYIKQFVVGDTVRDWSIEVNEFAFAPYSESFEPVELAKDDDWARWLWPMRSVIGSVISFGGKTRLECGDKWWTWYRWIPDKYVEPLSIVFAFVATHNHFVLDRGGKVFKQSAPVIKLLAETAEDEHLALLGLLNSSTAAIWLRQVCHDKGGGGIGGGIAAEAWERFLEYTGTKLLTFPVPPIRPLHFAAHLDRLAQQLTCDSPRAAIARWQSQLEPELVKDKSLRECLNDAFIVTTLIRGEMLLVQEDLDWECYRLYGLIDEDVTVRLSPEADDRSIPPGNRAFEIVMARKMAIGELRTTWFERHNITPQFDLPDPAYSKKYRDIVERRIKIIETNPQIALIEEPEYKRRWNWQPWDQHVQRDLREWVLDRLESYFDFDGRMNADGKPTAEAEIILISVTKLADLADYDSEFHQIGEALQGDMAFDVERLVGELVAAESVPLLPVLRYKPSGLRKRAEWEKTWALQHQEDAIDARTGLPAGDPQYLTEADARDLKRRELGEIPVPPKYTSADFISTGGARYWSLRGKLDVPKERWVSFPHCEGPDGTLVIAWAGYDHLQLARSIAAYYVDIQERLGGRDDPRLVPLLACLIELLPWLKQWHNTLDPEFGMAMGDYFEGFVAEEARQLGKTTEQIKAWQPQKSASRKGKSPKSVDKLKGA